MKNKPIRLAVGGTASVVAATLGLIFYLISQMSIFELIQCSADEDGIELPGAMCEYYMKKYRANAEDMEDLAVGGVDPILNLSDQEKGYEIAEFFISKGLSVNGANHYHYEQVNDSTPLHVSVVYNNPQRAKFLLSHGADLKIKSSYHNNMTPLELAKQIKKDDHSKDMKRIIQILSESTSW